MTAQPLDRSDPAFFHDPHTKERIEEVAALDDLVVFAGAGVTVDQTGVDWRTLITNIRSDPDRDDRPVCERMLTLYGERRTASAQAERFKTHGDGWRSLLEHELHRVVYSGGGWAGGRLAQSVAGLAATWAASNNRSICVATTNYEDYLEQAILDACQTFPSNVPITTHVLPKGDGSTPIDPDAVNLVYLHGYLPQQREKGTQERLDALGLPVFSEEDYINNEARCSAMLIELFTDRSVLLVGCGLTDEPLLRALLKTKPAARYQKARFVLLPLQSKEWQYQSRAELQELIDFYDLRLRHLGLVPIFPDFFSQTSQFLQEVSLCARSGKGAYKRKDSRITYGRRLTAWWNSWSSSRKINSDPVEMQRHDHDELVERLATIRTMLEAPESEPLKLEVWLRWEPSDASRRLHLWASTVGVFDDLSVMRRDEITTESEYVSLRVFCDGRPRRIPEHANDVSPKGRWGAYLASTIWLPDEDQATQIPVGVVTLASMWRLTGKPGDRHSCLHDDNRDKFRWVLPLLQDLGRTIADPKTAGGDGEGADSGHEA